MKNGILLIISFVLLVGCSSPTAYQSIDGDEDYNETQLKSNLFRVIFKGNENTSHERVADFALLRSAELSLLQNFEYFVILKETEYSKDESYTTLGISNANYSTNITSVPVGKNENGTIYNTHIYENSHSIYIPPEQVSISYPRKAIVIECYKKEPKTKQLYFNAAFILKSIKQKYQIK